MGGTSLARLLVCASLVISAACAPHRLRTPDPPPTGPFRTAKGEEIHPRCLPPTRRGPAGAAPRCVVSFGRGTTAVAGSPDGSVFLMAVLDVDPTTWNLPAVEFGHHFDPIPVEPDEVGKGEREGPQALVVSPDVRTTLFAVDDRLIRYDLQTGKVLGDIDGPAGKGMVDNVAWSPDGRTLAITTAGDGKARLVDATDGRVVRALPVDGRVVQMAFDHAGSRIALGTEIGTVAVIDLGTQSGRPRRLNPSTQEITGLGFLGPNLMVAARDGKVRIFDPISRTPVRQIDLGAPAARFALAPDGRYAAASDDRNVVRVIALPGGVVQDTFAWHQASITALAWGKGPTLLVADNDGELAAWSVSAASPSGGTAP